MTKEERRKKKEANYYLWTDEFSKKENSVARTFISDFRRRLGIGADKRALSSAILSSMGLSNTQNNARKIRGACHCLHHEMGILVVSLRSGWGGYFVASTSEERDKYVRDQNNFAQSMLRTAKLISGIDVYESLRKFQEPAV